MTTAATAAPVRDSGRGGVAFDGEVEVTARRDQAHGVVSLDLTPATGQRLPAWEPGAHIDVVLPDNMTRQYSLCGSIDDSATWRIGVLREPASRGGSEWLHDHAYPGVGLRVRGPRNHFRLVKAPRYVFIAGGIGITPLLPMITQVQQWGADWVLHYLGRQRASMAFLPELQHYGPRVVVTARDEADRLDLDTMFDQADSSTLVYGCGPATLLDALEAACRWRTPGSLHVERFAADPATAQQHDNVAFEVELRASGTTITVPADVSVLQAVTGAGVYVASSCAEGTCGSCETDVIEGEVDHRDYVLSPEEKASSETMMICVSRAKCGRLVLDL